MPPPPFCMRSDCLQRGVTKDLHNRASTRSLERCQSVLSPKSLKQHFPALVDSHFSGTFMVIVSPGGVRVCNVNTKLYAEESQGGHSAVFRPASPPLYTEMNPTKEAAQRVERSQLFLLCRS